MGDRAFFIRTGVLKEAVQNPDGSVTPSQGAQLEAALAEKVSPIESKSFDSVSPVVARVTARNAAIALVAASLAILLYITWAFRKVPKSFRYGVCTVIALSHDLVLVLGVFSILGKVMNMEVNSMFIVGLLTVLGYSDNNTIVVFDRIRENVLRNPDRALETTVNLSLWETLARSINTSVATLIALGALLLLGGPTIRPLLIVLFIGFVAGTYSSIFVSAQILVAWEKGEFRRVLRFLRLSRPKPTPTQSA
jgi:preprotein translocase subunit SecF